MMKLRTLALSALVLLASACAPAASGGASDGPRTRRDMITYEQIVATNQATLFDAIQRLQPSWLTPQGDGTRGAIGVFMNGARVGDVDFLSQIPASQVQEVRYLTSRAVAAELTSRQAMGLGSAIMITGRRM